MVIGIGVLVSQGCNTSGSCWPHLSQHEGVALALQWLHLLWIEKGTTLWHCLYNGQNSPCFIQLNFCPQQSIVLPFWRYNPSLGNEVSIKQVPSLFSLWRVYFPVVLKRGGCFLLLLLGVCLGLLDDVLLECLKKQDSNSCYPVILFLSLLD